MFSGPCERDYSGCRHLDNKPRCQRAGNWIVKGSRLKNICTWGGSFIRGYGLILCHCWAQIGASKGTEICEKNQTFIMLHFTPVIVLCPVDFSPFPFGPFELLLLTGVISSPPENRAILYIFFISCPYCNAYLEFVLKTSTKCMWKRQYNRI